MKKLLQTGLFLTLLSLKFFSISAYANGSIEELNDDRSIVERPEHSEENQLYTLAKSHYSVGLRTAIHGFPASSAIGDLHQLYAEWLIPYQNLGIFSIGGTLGSFALRELPTAFPYPNYLNTLSGGLIRYQLKFTPNQLIVPTASFEMIYYRLLRPNDSGYLSGTNSGASLGVFLNLGWIDRITARDAYASIKLTKTYLTAELRSASFANASFILDGTFYMFGLRTEFE